jgi:glycosyltransferase involved in cell wall biosynthesis
VSGLERVLFVDHTTVMGGAELSLARFLRSDAGSTAAIAFLTPNSADAWGLPPSVRVAHTRGVAGTTGIRSLVKELANVIASIDPDVIVANSFSAAQYLALVPKRGRRYVYFLRQEALPDGLPKTKAIFNRVFVLRRFDRFFANSGWTASTLPASIDRRRVVISRPISGVLADAADPKRFESVPTNVLTLSRLSPWKGVHTAIEAVRSIDQETPGSVSLTVAGGDLFGEEDYSALLRRLAEGIDVHFVGHTSDTRPLLSEAHILLCLSTTPEPFGQVVIQGMASGCVVIATDQGGPREVIRDGVDGFLVRPEDPEAVASVITAMQADPARAARIGENARARAKDFEDAVTIPAFANALADIPRSSGR